MVKFLLGFDKYVQKHPRFGNHISKKYFGKTPTSFNNSPLSNCVKRKVNNFCFLQ